MPNAIPDITEYRGYRIFFWSDEQKPLEPVHVHFSKGRPSSNATKYWINADGSIEQENNNSQIPLKDLRKLEALIKEYADDIIHKWESYFGEKAKYHRTDDKDSNIEDCYDISDER